MMENPALIPELDVADLAAALRIYQTVFGFELLFQRPEEAFAYVAMGGAHLMLQQADGPGRRFRTGLLEHPFGRGLNLQILVANLADLRTRVRKHELEVIIDVEERWYRQGAIERGNRQFVVADADGYLLRFYEDLGQR
jgi:catechol 2,3-dioxygenase-like lactoylglutathione lyase family enzyme